jgi:hypothetical protein
VVQSDPHLWNSSLTAIDNYNIHTRMRAKSASVPISARRDSVNSHNERTDYMIGVAGGFWDQIVEEVPQEHWAEMGEYIIAARELMKLIIRDGVKDEGWSYTEKDIADLEKKVETRFRKSIRLPPLRKRATKGASQHLAGFDSILRDLSHTLIARIEGACDPEKNSKIPIKDLLRSIGFQIGVYPKERESLYVKEASSTIVELLKTHQRQNCSGEELNLYASKLESKIRSSITRKRAQKEPEDSDNLETAIFQLRVIVTAFHHYYPKQMLQNYTSLFVKAYPDLTQNHPAEDFARFLTQAMLELVKLSQATTYKQFVATVNDITASLASSTKWPQDQILVLLHQPSMIFYNFYNSNTPEERRQLIGAFVKKYETESQNKDHFTMMVEHISELLDDFERYFKQFYLALSLIHQAQEAKGRKNEIVASVGAHYVQKRQTQPNKMPLVGTSATEPPRNGTFTDGSDPATNAKRDSKWWWSTTGTVLFSLTFSLITFLIFWILILRFCFKPSKIQKEDPNQKHRICRPCKKACSCNPATCADCKQATYKARFYDLWVWRWGERNKEAPNVGLIEEEEQLQPPMTHVDPVPLVCLDGPTDSSSRLTPRVDGSEVNGHSYLFVLLCR